MTSLLAPPITSPSALSETLRSQGHAALSPEGLAELKALHGRVLENLRLALNVFTTRDLALARRLVAEKAAIRDFEAKPVDRPLHRWVLATAPQPAGNWSSSAFADLDGDSDLEVVLGHAAYHHDGTPLYVSGVAPGYPSIANLDADPEPEVLVTNVSGLSLLNHDGTVIYQDQRPTGDPPGATTWLRPSTVHDFDGDGKSEYATSSANNYTLYNPQGPTIMWQAPVSDQSGIAAGTARPPLSGLQGRRTARPAGLQGCAGHACAGSCRPAAQPAVHQRWRSQAILEGWSHAGSVLLDR